MLNIFPIRCNINFETVISALNNTKRTENVSLDDIGKFLLVNLPRQNLKPGGLHVSKGFYNLLVLGWSSAFRAKSIYHVCIEMRPKNNTCISTTLSKNIRVGRSEIIFIFLKLFIC